MASPYDPRTLELAQLLADRFTHSSPGAGGAGGAPPMSMPEPMGSYPPAELPSAAGTGAAPIDIYPPDDGSGGAPPMSGAQGAPAAAPDPLVAPPPAAPAVPAPAVREGRTVPGAMLTDRGQMVPVTAGLRRPAPRRLARGPARPPIPGAFHDGQYYPQDNGIELLRLRGEISDEQARAAEAARPGWQRTVPGMQAQMQRQQFANERANLDTMEPAFDAQRREFDARGEQLQRLEDYQASERLAQQERREAYERELKSQEDKYHLALQDIAKSQVDPNRLSKTTGDKIARGIRGFLGALGAALLGRPNETAEDMAREIDRDIAAQEKNLARKERGAEAQKGVLGIMRARYGDMEQAQAAARQFYYQQLDAELGQVSNETQSEEHKARIAALRQELGQRAQLNELALQQQGRARADEIARQRMLLLMQRQAPRGALAGKSFDARFVPGMGLAPDAKRAEAMQKLLADGKMTQEAIAELEYLIAKGGKSLPGELRGQVQAAATLTMIQANNTLGIGVLDEGNKESLRRVINDPDQLFSLDSATRARLGVLSRHIARRTRAHAQSMGFVPATRAYGSRGAEYTIHQGADTNRTPTAARFKPLQ